MLTTRPVSDEALIDRMLPDRNADRQDRERAWAEWQASVGEHVLARYVGAHNHTLEADDDIIQDALITAYLGVERGLYRPRDGVPFAAYVIGIARNKIREAWRRDRHRADLGDEQEELGFHQAETTSRQLETTVERREERDLLRGGLQQLSDARRKVIEHYLSGASTGEIAERMAISEDLVRQHKCRGLRSLQRHLGGGGVELGRAI